MCLKTLIIPQLYLLGRHLFEVPRVSDTHNSSAGNASDPRFWTGFRTGDAGEGLFEDEMFDDSKRGDTYMTSANFLDFWNPSSYCHVQS